MIFFQCSIYMRPWFQQPRLWVQHDNTVKELKNGLSGALCAHLVLSDLFYEASHNCLPVGHTHEDIGTISKLDINNVLLLTFSFLPAFSLIHISCYLRQFDCGPRWHIRDADYSPSCCWVSAPDAGRFPTAGCLVWCSLSVLLNLLFCHAGSLKQKSGQCSSKGVSSSMWSWWIGPFGFM